MKYCIKKIYLILFCAIFFLLHDEAIAKKRQIEYSKYNISNYFLGIVSANQNYTDIAYKYLKKVKFTKKGNSNFNRQFIRTLVLLENFDKAFDFSKDVWSENELFFEAELLLGIHSFINEDYSSAEKYFKRLNENFVEDFIFYDFLSDMLVSWVRASENRKDESFELLEKIPEDYKNLKQIQNIFLHCYFKSEKTEILFDRLLGEKDKDFSRYDFFLANYFISKNENTAAKIIITKSRNINNSNLLIKQAENFILNGKNKKIINLFNCENPKDSIAEIFYVIANFYSSIKDYKLSNFYLKISLFLNSNFTPNKNLLAENFFLQKKYELSKKVYNSIKTIGPIYAWHASINLAQILLETTNNEKLSIKNLEKEFDLIQNPNFDHYYELANFYKDYEYYEKSIKYYSLALKNINEKHYLFPKILDRRGTSYERAGEWKKAEKDLLKSLEILPKQPHVLNYLAYSWIEKRTNIKKALEMLERATNLRKNDGYIIDSLGWAHYVNENYFEAEKFLQKAVELMPLDPVINDHYADALWMINKKLQAIYFWEYVLSLDTTEKKLKDIINKKLIFGVTKKL